mgnify:FL=1
MTLRILAPQQARATVELPLSKSISNRALILGSLAQCTRFDCALCDDTHAMRNALSILRQDGEAHIDVGAAGTAMRFLTAYCATLENKVTVIDGCERMRQRPIGVLVDALRSCGAKIEYLREEGFPPLRITGNALSAKRITIPGGTSSQFISALLMIAPVVQGCRAIEIEGEAVSMPYIDMTIAMMREFGVDAQRIGNVVEIPPKARYSAPEFKVEADWSAASYWFEIAALLPGSEITLKGLRRQSIQGDSTVAEHFAKMGVGTEWMPGGDLRLFAIPCPKGQIALDLNATPDLAPTLIATACALGFKKVSFTGLKTLRIKETDRLEALRAELRKLGYEITIVSDDEIAGVNRCEPSAHEIHTYGDHRMAMAFAPLSACHQPLDILNPEVVSKSYPDFWSHLALAGFEFENL